MEGRMRGARELEEGSSKAQGVMEGRRRGARELDGNHGGEKEGSSRAGGGEPWSGEGGDELESWRMRTRGEHISSLGSLPIKGWNPDLHQSGSMKPSLYQSAVLDQASPIHHLG